MSETTKMHPPLTLSVYSENTPGTLHRITAVLTRRKINIESLTVSETEDHDISRFTILVRAPKEELNKVVKAIDRVIEVRKVLLSQDSQLILSEISLIRVKTTSAEDRLKIEDFARSHDAEVRHVNENDILLEKVGREEEIDSLRRLLEPFGIIEFIRSGRIALLKEATNIGSCSFNSNEQTLLRTLAS